MIVLYECPVDGRPCDGCATWREPCDDAAMCWLEMSDEEVLARARLAGEDPQEAEDRVRAVFLKLLRESEVFVTPETGSTVQTGTYRIVDGVLLPVRKPAEPFPK